MQEVDLMSPEQALRMQGREPNPDGRKQQGRVDSQWRERQRRGVDGEQQRQGDQGRGGCESGRARSPKPECRTSKKDKGGGAGVGHEQGRCRGQ